MSIYHTYSDLCLLAEREAHTASKPSTPGKDMGVKLPASKMPLKPDAVAMRSIMEPILDPDVIIQRLKLKKRNRAVRACKPGEDCGAGECTCGCEGK